MDHFLPSHQNFTQNSARNSKIGDLKILVKKRQKICSFQGLKIHFGIQWQYRIFWHVSRIQKGHLIWRRQKVEVDSTPSAPCVYLLLNFLTFSISGVNKHKISVKLLYYTSLCLKNLWNRNKNTEMIKLQEIVEFVLFSFPIFWNQKSPLIENKKQIKNCHHWL